MFILVNKPKGITSHGVVAKVRKIISMDESPLHRLRRIKVGHAGTLDPNATGLLILGIGRESTKNLDRFLKLDKEYLADIYLGEERDTEDADGKSLISNSEFLIESQIPISKIRTTLKGFMGKQMQTPPIYSAIKVGGKEAYKLARAGKDVVLKPREITVYETKLMEYNFPILTVKFKVSSGTYIRSLARDIGRKLGTGAYLSDLVRTKVGKYNLKKAVLLNELNPENWKSFAFDI
ncbi:MAG: tRNA pseudouridine synthase B [Candidatus Woesebacteria bacterium GW2011_GWA1_37_8]|uniref:tRNA pseudouridine synthase B n=2 Tax=Candidatus Woeseibacteriota TaxID=1752722 RepID=A0A0G0L716_9BACT|nr:MAG: tRNA pseudouridine synthase B [Microgenomates group bacterium GW2011_GWC1_37_12b]KKQ44955.1 MAG: tRNA pseudouridine synthase B [Candidatus Woesebacteria bacterium GW2011_GWA1_37_8]KKQ87828.1 MAG: tRNA pseudouridine synthase B [Candidatus Woesebacteria bacterium GW2011_GWB1_38_8b]